MAKESVFTIVKRLTSSLRLDVIAQMIDYSRIASERHHKHAVETHLNLLKILVAAEEDAIKRPPENTSFVDSLEQAALDSKDSLVAEGTNLNDMQLNRDEMDRIVDKHADFESMIINQFPYAMNDLDTLLDILRNANLIKVEEAARQLPLIRKADWIRAIANSEDR